MLDRPPTSIPPMSAATSPSEAAVRLAPPQRTRGMGRVAFKHEEGRTRLRRLFQEGAAKIRLPRNDSGHPEAVLINTAGGLTGGDELAWEIEAGPGARATITTQACEKIYRAAAGRAIIETRLTLGAGARLDWLPQETILFDRAALHRGLEADLHESARLLACEAIVFGRQAMGERVVRGSLRESWRVRRNGRLVFADEFRLEGAIADILARPAVMAGARACATILYCGPDAEALIGPARDAIGDAGGASALDGRILARLVAPDALALRRALVPLLVALRAGAPLPKAWHL